MRRVLTAIALLCAGCSAQSSGERDCMGPPPPTGNGFSPEDPPEIAIALRGVDGSVMQTTNGSAAPIVGAPQGGFIVLAGFRARNMDVCTDLTAAIRDESDANRIVSLEQRPAQLVLGTDGWMTPALPDELFNWANLPACPNAALTRDLAGQSWLLEITVRDKNGRTASASQHVVPFCAEPALEEYCMDVCTLGP